MDATIRRDPAKALPVSRQRTKRAPISNCIRPGRQELTVRAQKRSPGVQLLIHFHLLEISTPRGLVGSTRVCECGRCDLARQLEQYTIGATTDQLQSNFVTETV
jgi:hypothetical protein